MTIQRLKGPRNEIVAQLADTGTRPSYSHLYKYIVYAVIAVD
jgi:hypothetical protein